MERGWKLQWGSGGLALAIVLVLVAALSGGAGAAVDSANLPAKTARELKALGLDVSWPLATDARTVRAGTRLLITVADLNASALDVTGQVTLTRVRAKRVTTLASVPLGDVAGSSLSGWRLSLLIPPTVGAHDDLTITAGTVRYTSRVSVTAASDRTGGPAVAQAATVTLAPTQSVPGDTVHFSVTDTGSETLRLGSLAWQREGSNGAWSDYAYGAACCPTERACPEYLVLARYVWSVTLGPGDTVSNTATVPPATADGSFRLAPGTSGLASTSASGIALRSEPTQVTASALCQPSGPVTDSTPTVTTGPVRPGPTVTTAPPTTTTPTATTGPIRPLSAS